LFVYTGYMDESGTHDGSPITVMGGVLARAEEWRSFEERFECARKVHGFNVFHTKKFKRRAGDFKGWTNEKCLALLSDLAQLTGGGLLTGAASVTLGNDAYDRYYKGDGAPRKVRLDSKYGLCFRTCLLHFIVETMKRQYRKKMPDLHIVIEAGHRNSGDAERIFLEFKKELRDAGADMLRTLTLAEKDDCGQLMMADFVAHTTFSMGISDKPGPRDITPFIQGPQARRLKRATVLHLESTPEALAAMRADVIKKVPSRKASSSAA
jgi:Protein of unknown function (DUF3800)